MKKTTTTAKKIKGTDQPCRIKKNPISDRLTIIPDPPIQLGEIGIKEWLKQQEERWLCSNCNHPYSWFEEKCVGCGSELFNATAESKSLK